MAKNNDNYLSPTIAELYHALTKSATDWRRDHAGASGIGEECERKIYNSFRWWRRPEYMTDGRVLRLFRRGAREELDLTDDLEAAGVQVSTGPDAGSQWSKRVLGGHFGGSMDFALLGLKELPGIWHMGEAKTHNKKSFDHLVKHGVRKSKPKHYAQCLIYCELFGFNYVCYIAVCKDDDRIYMERFKSDPIYAGELLEKAADIITAKKPPNRISSRPDFYQCQWCDYFDSCHMGAKPVKSCRTCTYSEPVLDNTTRGAWLCKERRAEITSKEQREGCSKYVEIGSSALNIIRG
jgi:hypothetical protein